MVERRYTSYFQRTSPFAHWPRLANTNVSFPEIESVQRLVRSTESGRAPDRQQGFVTFAYMICGIRLHRSALLTA
jgi:hypothetical protein